MIKLGYCQYLDSTLTSLKMLDFSRSAEFVNQVEDETINKLLKLQINYYLTGRLEKLQNIPKLDFSKTKKSAIKKILIADYLYLKKDFSKNNLIFSSYFEAYNISKKLKDSFIASEALRKINRYILNRARDTSMFFKYLKMYEPFAKKSEYDSFWYNYTAIGYEFLRTEKKVEILNKNYINFLYRNCSSAISKKSLLQGLIYQSESIYYAHWFKDYDLSNQKIVKALEVYKRYSSWFSQSKMSGLEFNFNINKHKLGKHKKAIDFFRKDLERDKEPIYKMLTNRLLGLCYEALGNQDSALYYLKEESKLKDQLNQLKHSREVKKIEQDSEIERKEKKLILLAKEKTKLQSNLYTLIPILGLVTFVLAVIFYLYRRYRRKSVVLEEEKSETLQKLDELKQIVIKNHVVLKDKTKVYISDLMYIKADDHYLNLFLSNGKNHFVRGKLKNIKEELPPNFIQCHRSYIVNANFIKQKNSTTLVMINQETIPLSRSFKDRF